MVPKVEKDYSIVINRVREFYNELKNIKNYIGELTMAATMQLFF